MLKKQTAAWLACLAWMGVIFAMSAMPGDVSGAQSGAVTRLLLFLFSALPGVHAVSGDMLELLVRKGAHMAEYAVLFVLYRRALRLSGVRRAGMAALCMCAAYAAADEAHQGFVDGRRAAAADVLIDTLGAASAAALTRIAGRIKRSRAEQ